MNVKEFFKEYCYFTTEVEVVSGYNEKVLARNYRIGKKPEVDERIVSSIEVKLKTENEGKYAKPILKIWVHGGVECEKELEKRENQND